MVNIEVRDPQGRVEGRYGGRHVIAAGTCRLALNEPPGEWTLSLYERYNRIRSQARFDLL